MRATKKDLKIEKIKTNYGECYLINNKPINPVSKVNIYSENGDKLISQTFIFCKKYKKIQERIAQYRIEFGNDPDVQFFEDDMFVKIRLSL